MVKLSNPDLTKFPPRSPRVRLAGYAHLPRILDKARATIAGKAGEYSYDCPLDEFFFEFTRIDAKALLAKVKKGASDTEIAEWVESKSTRTPSEIAAWTSWIETRSPGGFEGHQRFGKSIHKMAKGRDDIRTIFDLLDLDDYVTFGGKA
jgi:Domain of unknown function (DUF5069)